MSYEPSHRKPPRQERWPNATPGEGWPAYQQGDGSRAWDSAAARESGAAWEPAAAFAGSGTGSRNGHAASGNGYRGTGVGYAGAWDGYGDTWDGRGSARYGDDGHEGHGYGSPGYGSPGYAGSGPWAAGNGYGTTTAYPAAGDGYADGFDGATDGYASAGPESYHETGNGHGYDGNGHDGNGHGYDGWDAYTQPGHEFTGSAGYLAQDEYPALDPAASSVLVAPDTMGEWWRQADPGRDGDRDPGDRDPGERGPVVGAVTGLLAAAVAIGVATFAAAFVRPQASPVSAVAGALTGYLPAALRNHLMAHFGAHGQTVLLVGAIGLAAMVFGCLARRNPSLGVAGIAALGLLGAFVAITRPESRASDVIPWAIGGTAGILALLWLAQASAPTPGVTSLRPAYSGGGRRRAR